jgi:demethylmenaquinone methyltransferase / 2-methoxy-6-polyprenyl-1,4-benzoquinol methylase
VVPNRPKLVLDVATGTAGVALVLADRTDAHVVGVDLTEEMLRTGRQRVEARARGQRIALALARGEQLPFADATFDALTFTYLLRYVADPAATLAELARVVSPGGTLASLEFGVPTRLLWRAAWHLHTRVVLPVGGLLWVAWPGPGSDSSWGRRSSSTTGPTRCSATWRCGRRPASRMSGCDG